MGSQPERNACPIQLKLRRGNPNEFNKSMATVDQKQPYEAPMEFRQSDGEQSSSSYCHAGCQKLNRSKSDLGLDIIGHSNHKHCENKSLTSWDTFQFSQEPLCPMDTVKKMRFQLDVRTFIGQMNNLKLCDEHHSERSNTFKKTDYEKLLCESALKFRNTNKVRSSSEMNLMSNHGSCKKLKRSKSELELDQKDYNKPKRRRTTLFN